MCRARVSRTDQMNAPDSIALTSCNLLASRFGWITGADIAFDLADQPHALTQDTYTPGVSWVALVAF